VSLRRRAAASALSYVVAVMIIGTIGYVLIEDMTVLDALYMTTITVTTIGFKEVAPLSTTGRFFTIAMAFAGIGVILLTATEIARVILEGNLRRIIDRRREHTMIKRLSNHIVVCGHGRHGRAVVDILRNHTVPFVVVEMDPDACDDLESRRIPFVQGDATNEDVLRAARVDQAATFLACLGDDAHNVYAILLARQLQPSITIIALAVEEGSEERIRLAGAHRVINPYVLGGNRLALTALKPAMIDFIDDSLLDSNLELELAEIRVEPGSNLDGKTLAEAHVLRKFGIMVIATKRDQTTRFNPDGSFRMQANDTLVALGPLDALESAEKVATLP
jgi:voltage-gated potassium channel